MNRLSWSTKGQCPCTSRNKLFKIYCFAHLLFWLGRYFENGMPRKMVMVAVLSVLVIALFLEIGILLFLPGGTSQPSWLDSSFMLTVIDGKKNGLVCLSKGCRLQSEVTMTSWRSEIDFFILSSSWTGCATSGFLILESCLQFCCWEDFSWDIVGFPFNSETRRVSHETSLDFLCLAEKMD